MEVNHVGNYVFNGTLKDLGRLEFAAHGVDEVDQRKKKDKNLEKKGE